MPCSQKNAKKHAIVEMWLALAATNKKVGAYNSTSKLICKVTKTIKWWVARRDICHKSFPRHAWSHTWPVWNM